MLSVLRVRDVLLRTRTKLINCARGLVKPTGARIPSCAASSFAVYADRSVPAELRLALPLVALTDDTVHRLKDILVEHPGGSPVLLHVGDKVLRLPPEFNVDSRNGLVGELKALLGAGAVVP